MRFHRGMLGLLFFALLAIIAAACSQEEVVYSPPPDTYRIRDANGSIFCYYYDSPLETITRKALGECDANDIPRQMPEYMRYRYYAYYHSPAYYNVYVPVERRSVYIETVRVVEREKRTEIQRESQQATWKDSKGKTVSGADVQKQQESGKALFGTKENAATGGSQGASRPISGVTPAVPKTGSTAVTKPIATPAPPGTAAPASAPATGPTAATKPAQSGPTSAPANTGPTPAAKPAATSAPVQAAPTAASKPQAPAVAPTSAPAPKPQAPAVKPAAAPTSAPATKR